MEETLQQNVAVKSSNSGVVCIMCKEKGFFLTCNIATMDTTEGVSGSV